MPKVLLVEDDNNLREIFEMRLQAEGYDTISASDGEEALVVAVKEKPDLIIADVMMPKLSGFEMVEAVRAAPDMANAKVIMMTALGQAEDRARGDKLGVVKYLVKSQVTLEDFVRVVREVLPPDQAGASIIQPSTPDNAAKTEELNNNKVESENSMPEDSQTPTNPQDTTPPAGDAAAGTNPISGTPPAGDAAVSGAQSAADEQNAVQNQVNDFVSGAPSADASAPATPSADEPAPAAPSVSPTGELSTGAESVNDAPASTPPPSDLSNPAPAGDQPAEGGTPPAEGGTTEENTNPSGTGSAL